MTEMVISTEITDGKFLNHTQSKKNIVVMRGKPKGKVRNPFVVFLLVIFTLGIYGIIWEYSILEELRNWRGQGWSGTLFLILLLLFAFPLFVLPWLIPSYIGKMYAEENREKPITGFCGFWIFIPIIGAIVWIFRVQSCLNRFWESV